MIKDKNELMMKMCASEKGGVGVEVDGILYFYENFDDDTITRIYKHFGTERNFVFYSSKWAHQRRIKELMDGYAAASTDLKSSYEKCISEYIAKWSGCTIEKALNQVKAMTVSYLSIY